MALWNLGCIECTAEECVEIRTYVYQFEKFPESPEGDAVLDRIFSVLEPRCATVKNPRVDGFRFDFDWGQGWRNDPYFLENENKTKGDYKDLYHGRGLPSMETIEKMIDNGLYMSEDEDDTGDVREIGTRAMSLKWYCADRKLWQLECTSDGKPSHWMCID
jgi:hypothetical protein